MYSRAEEYRKKNVLLTKCLSPVCYGIQRPVVLRDLRRKPDEESLAPWGIAKAENNAYILETALYGST